ncbi:type II toxin-antitoxin system RelE/ParE family toxin [Stenotrophomonas sp.]|uniref:type II toxin-antitoxin system RelE/ParE family toxin n=1 Tax=Stenotrophomonas sp. TaxID=69392 RepID=UPI002FCB9FCE
MKPARWHPRAVQDADDVAAWYAQQAGVTLELAFVDALERTVSLLERHPGAGSTRHADAFPELHAPLRFHPILGFDDHLVYYTEHPAWIEIVRLWNARRGLDALHAPDAG